jgi:hypothetical protein
VTTTLPGHHRDGVRPSPSEVSPTMRVRNRRLRLLVALLAVLAPGRVRRFLFVRLLGHDIHPGAHLGRSFVDVERLVMGEGSVIGPLNVVRGCALVDLERDAKIGTLNWINSVRLDRGTFESVQRHPALIMRQAALITMMHFVDACDTVELAPWATIAGFWTLVQTHSVDFDACAQASHPVYIGDHSLVSSRCALLPGSVVPDSSLVAGGAVVNGVLRHPHLFGGVPARPLRELDPQGAFFTRDVVDIR